MFFLLRLGVWLYNEEEYGMNIKAFKLSLYIITILSVLCFVQVQYCFASDNKCEYEYDKLNRKRWVDIK